MTRPPCSARSCRRSHGHVSASAEVCMAEVLQTALPRMPERRTLRIAKWEGRMTDFGRRDFLKGAVAGSVATTGPLVAEVQAQTPAPAAASTSAPTVSGYAFLNL